VHLQLSRKYLREAEEFLAKGDHVQASEKAWGAAAQAAKMVASKKGLELRSHGELHKFIMQLAAEARLEGYGSRPQRCTRISMRTGCRKKWSLATSKM
jgi:hypothetical protein